jgi:LmbE family N-acetylglucosaminyl deacetylase
MFSKILVISPHTDDGELGCGGAISKFIDEGKEIFYVALSTCEKSVPKGFPSNILKKEVREATKTLGIKKDNLLIYDYNVREFPNFRQEILETLIKVRKKVNPDLVFTTSSYDIHQDHKVTQEETIRAFKESTVLGYEQPWNNMTFNTTAFIPIDELHVKRKIKALKCYNSQNSRVYMSENFIFSLALIRGTPINVPYAEAFEVMRLIL